MSPKTPGRNEPCWCGSGKKYKKCHLTADRNAVQAGQHMPLRTHARDYAELLRGSQVRSSEIGPDS